ncbi:MAG: TetR/AcrR family transcriptional regulator [Caldilineaceae bacterium]|nr:TetR/AcrR family transcriptional regulator [Caldilineaceae bacterium]
MEEQTRSSSKETILDAAQDLLARHGYAGLSMRELALESGLAKATIYHYFQDKEDIFRQVLERDLRRVHTHISAAMEKEEGCLAKLRAVIYNYFGLMHTRRAIMMGVIRDLGESKRLFREIMCTHREIHLGPIMRLLQQGIDEGVFRPVNVEYTTYSLLSMINAFVISRHYFQDVMPQSAAPSKEAADPQSAYPWELDEDVAEHTLQLILHGIQTPSSTSTPQS